MWYIYIFEDNTVKKTKEKPTHVDLSCISEGILTVIQCEGEPKEIAEDGTLVDLGEATTNEGFKS